MSVRIEHDLFCRLVENVAARGDSCPSYQHLINMISDVDPSVRRDAFTVADRTELVLLANMRGGVLHADSIDDQHLAVLAHAEMKDALVAALAQREWRVRTSQAHMRMAIHQMRLDGEAAMEERDHDREVTARAEMVDRITLAPTSKPKDPS